jgi:hypothetical protein
VYQCSKCKKTMTKLWNDSATTTYKDRVWNIQPREIFAFPSNEN